MKGLRGVDNETGRIFDRSLRKISQGKLHPDFTEQNLKQQAGFSAEITSVSRKNADAIIKGELQRLIRSEDVPEFGKNNTVVDISPDEFCQNMNQFTELLGKKLTINNMDELDEVMLSSESIRI